MSEDWSYEPMLGDIKPTVVCLCGSTRFKEAFEKAARDETLEGKIVLTVGLFGHLEGLDMSGDTKKMLDQLHFRKIDLAQQVLFLNVGNYLGESSLRELSYARSQGKTIRFLEDTQGKYLDNNNLFEIHPVTYKGVDLTEEEVSLLRQHGYDRRIHVIKMVRNRTGLGLREAIDCVNATLETRRP